MSEETQVESLALALACRIDLIFLRQEKILLFAKAQENPWFRSIFSA